MEPITSISLHDYWELLEALDWRFDDLQESPAVWRKRSEAMFAARRMSWQSLVHRQMFVAFEKHNSRYNPNGNFLKPIKPED